MSSLDPYRILGVSKTASKADIKKAYRSLAKKYHPDTTEGDKSKEERFKEITAAYDILSDDQRRAQFDQMSQSGFSHGGHRQADFSSLSDLFAQMFGGQPGVQFEFSRNFGQGPRAGSPFGGRHFGGGSPFDGFSQTFSGQRPKAPRSRSKPKTTTGKVKAQDGSILNRNGLDVKSDVRLSFTEAIAGTTQTIPTLAGKSKVKIPPGTSSGTKLRLAKKGLKAQNGRIGDHIVTVQIDVPDKLSSKARATLRKLERQLKEDS